MLTTGMKLFRWGLHELRSPCNHLAQHYMLLPILVIICINSTAPRIENHQFVDKESRSNIIYSTKEKQDTIQLKTNPPPRHQNFPFNIKNQKTNLTNA
jgi:hypothetical protein